MQMKSDSFAPKTDTEKPFKVASLPKRQASRWLWEEDGWLPQGGDGPVKIKTRLKEEGIWVWWWTQIHVESHSRCKQKPEEEEKSGKWEGLVYAPPGRQKDGGVGGGILFRTKKEGEEDQESESGHRDLCLKEFPVTAYKAVQEKSSSPPKKDFWEPREKLGAKGDFPTGKSSFSITREAQVNVRMDSFDEDLARWDVVHLDPQGFSLTSLHKVVLERGQTPLLFLHCLIFSVNALVSPCFSWEKCASQSNRMFGAVSRSVFSLEWLYCRSAGSPLLLSCTAFITSYTLSPFHSLYCLPNVLRVSLPVEPCRIHFFILS